MISHAPLGAGSEGRPPELTSGALVSLEEECRGAPALGGACICRAWPCWPSLQDAAASPEQPAPLQAGQPAQAGHVRVAARGGGPADCSPGLAAAGGTAASFRPDPALSLAPGVGLGWHQPTALAGVPDSPRKDPGYHLLRHYITPAVAAAAAVEFGPEPRAAGRAIWALQ